MDANQLPFNAETMLAGLREWVECESPTYDAAAVNRMMDMASRALIVAGARIERIAGRMGFGDCVRATFPHVTPHAPGILVMSLLGSTIFGIIAHPTLSGIAFIIGLVAARIRRKVDSRLMRIT